MNDGDGAHFAETGVKEAIVDPGAGTKAMGFPGILKAHFNLGIMNL